MIHAFLAAALSLFNYVNVPVTDMRDEPSPESKVTSQAYMSEPLHVIEEKGKWAKVESAIDGYEGWIQKSDFYQSNAPFLSDSSAPIVKVNVPVANLYATPDTGTQPLMALPFESCLETLGTNDPLWIKVALPDGREAFIQQADVILEPNPVSREELFDLCQSFVGQPSLSTGRSSFGYGSSEFVQMLYREMGIYLPRDLQGQCMWEGFETIALENLSPGDLIYFGNEDGAIVSAGMYLGDNQLIHADTENTHGIQIEHLSSLTETYSNLSGKTLKSQVSTENISFQKTVNLHSPKMNAEMPALNINVSYETTPGAAPEQFDAEEHSSIPLDAIDSLEGPNAKIHDQQFAYYFLNEQKLPLVISPNESDTSKVTLESFQTWAESHQRELKELISKHGGILLRDFPINNSADFVSVLRSVLGRDPMDYRGGEGSRTKIIEGVYTSIDAPSKFHLPLHNELSCTNNPPEYFSFFCETAPEPGTGHTILGRTENVTQAIMKEPEVWDLFKDKNLKYISRHPPEGNLFTRVNNTHKTWQHAFETNDKQEVERICTEKGLEFEWQGDWIEVTRTVPAIKGPDEYFDHPYWFNQAHLYHGNPRIRGGIVNHVLANTLYILPSTRQYDIFFEDGSSIPRKIIYKVYDILERETVSFDWNKGDVMIVHNIKTMHGRSPFKGQRRILVSYVE